MYNLVRVAIKGSSSGYNGLINKLENIDLPDFVTVFDVAKNGVVFLVDENKMENFANIIHNNTMGSAKILGRAKCSDGSFILFLGSGQTLRDLDDNRANKMWES